MNCFLNHRFHFLKSKTSQAYRNSEGHFVSEGTLIFQNGAEYEGQLVDGRIEGRGRLRFPEGSIVAGEFKNNTFLQGKITFGEHSSLECEVFSDPLTNEEYLKQFVVTLKSGWMVRGACAEGGTISHAEILNSQGEFVKNFEGEKMKFPHPQKKGLVIIITRTWIYEGFIVQPSDSAQSESIQFLNSGTQVWMKGFGYLRLELREGRLTKQLLRIYKKLCFFRETVLIDNHLVCSATSYANGCFFLTAAEPSSGRLLVPLRHGSFRQFTCKLQDPIVVKGFIRVGKRRIECKLSEQSQLEFFDFRRSYSINDLATLPS